MTAIQNSVYFWLALIGLLAVLAALPTLIALIRGADDISYIVLLNVICCVTVFGWPIALITAIRWPRRYPTPPRTSLQRSPAPPLDRHRSRTHERGPYA
ncbi:superinfection immunity protein [Spirillospora sp. NPDC048819]|uniref:superinfection immunity protein n=1 Tax=Spirillospora sp. NPDC048819 TaxID=3155268 RepID=UPI0033C2F3C4